MSEAGIFPSRPTSPYLPLEDWVRGWLAECEFEIDEDWMIDDLTDAALPDMPIRYQDEARHEALHRAFEQVAYAEGRGALTRARGDER